MTQKDITIADLLEYEGADLSKIKDYGWRKINCPWHGDLHASAQVSLDAEGGGAFKCYACDIYGDVINTIARANGFGTADNPDRKAAYEWAKEHLGSTTQRVSRANAKRDEPERKPNSWRDELFA